MLVISSHTKHCSAFLPVVNKTNSFKMWNRNATKSLRINTQGPENCVYTKNERERKKERQSNSVYKQLALYRIKWKSINRVFSTKSRNHTNLIFPHFNNYTDLLPTSVALLPHTTHSHHIFSVQNVPLLLSACVCFRFVKHFVGAIFQIEAIQTLIAWSDS